MTSIFIGIYSPYPGAGKSTLADALCNNYQFERVKLARVLKNILRFYLRDQGLTNFEIESMIEGSDKNKPSRFLGGKTPRHAMQTLGTEWGRNCMGENFWVDAFINYVRQIRREGRSVVCDDVRFPNEFDRIVADGGFMVKITRPEIAPKPVGIFQQVKNFMRGRKPHTSEGGLENKTFNFEITNDFDSPEDFVAAYCETVFTSAKHHRYFTHQNIFS